MMNNRPGMFPDARKPGANPYAMPEDDAAFQGHIQSARRPTAGPVADSSGTYNGQPSPGTAVRYPPASGTPASGTPAPAVPILPNNVIPFPQKRAEIDPRMLAALLQQHMAQ